MPQDKKALKEKRLEKKRRMREKKEAAKAKKIAERKALYQGFAAIDFTGVGRCLRPGCTCQYFIEGTKDNPKTCYGCFHSNVYHTKTRAERKREREKKLEKPPPVFSSPNRPSTAPAVTFDISDAQNPIFRKNSYPCSLPTCECGGFQSSKPWPIIPLEVLVQGPDALGDFSERRRCRNSECRHADMYHIPEPVEEGGKKGKKGKTKGKGRPRTGKKR